LCHLDDTTSPENRKLFSKSKAQEAAAKTLADAFRVLEKTPKKD
jgi:hypothetical protein